MESAYYGSDRQARMLRQDVQDRWQDAYQPLRHLDPILVLAALGLAAIGIVMVHSATAGLLRERSADPMLFTTKQIISLGIGIGAMIAMALFDYRHFRAWSIPFYIAVVVLLAAVLTPMGLTVNGAQRWIQFGGFQVQPSELAKVAVILLIGALLHEQKGDIGLGAIMSALALLAVPMGLIFLEPDLGTMIVFIWLGFVLFLIAGVKARYLVGLAAMGVGAIFVAFQLELIKAYQLTRLTAFLDAGSDELSRSSGYHLDQALIAIGSGQLTGKGLGQGSQNTLRYVPENHTDFIFTVVGEELGFLGAVLVLGLFAILLWRGLRIAALAKDQYGRLIAAGTVGLISLQVLVNIGMTVGIMPVTGMPLPFVSYGSNALIAFFMLVGAMLNVHMRRFN